MGIELCPADGDECSWGQVSQKCKCQPKQYKPGRHIHECADNERHHAEVREGIKGRGEVFGDEEGNDNEGQYDDWDYSDRQRCNTPEFLLYISGERKVPPRTVNTTEDGAKCHQEQDVVPYGISVIWNVECRDVRVIRGEGGRCRR